MEPRLKLAEVPDYILNKTGVKRSRQTIYNWVDKGVTIEKQTYRLQIETHAGQKFTKATWVDEFIARLDARP